jgi:molybdopterin/thiamine biosynthesis adenylyltransferase
MRPQLKETLVVDHDGATFRVSRDGAPLAVPGDPEIVRLLLPLLDGTRTVSELVSAVADAWPSGDVASVLDDLDRAGLLEDADAKSRLSPAASERYFSNLTFFETFARLDRSRFDFQERLLDSHVLLLGVGGLGSTLLFNLAGLGVGRVTALDYDRVELRNFARQFLYTAADIGKPKLASAVARAKAFNPEIEIVPAERLVDGPGAITSILEGVDLVVAAIDQPAEVQAWVNEACVGAGVPFITGGFDAERGLFYSVEPGRSGCHACWQAFAGATPGQEGPVAGGERTNRGIGPVASLVASLIALEALRYLTRFAEPISAGRLWEAESSTGRIRVAYEWSRIPSCPVCGSAGAGDVETAAVTADDALSLTSRLDLLPLSIVQDGEDYVVGHPPSATFISVPEVGVVALRELLAGRTIGEAGEAASVHAGQTVDIVDFAQALEDAGLVATAAGSARTGAQRDRRWIAAVPQRLARPLFSTAAWAAYGTLFAACVAVFVLRPAYWPSFEDFLFYPNVAFCIVFLTVVSLVLTACHEVFHWLAARAVGVPARFELGRRLFLPVIETDLSQLWSVPRRQRYGPFLAGMAFDTVVLALALLPRVAWGEGFIGLPPLLYRFLGVIVLFQVFSLGFQTVVFLKTDLYAVMTALLRCRNLQRVTYLATKSRLMPLPERQRRELNDAHPRDVRVAPVFALLSAAGFALAAWFFVTIFFPGSVVVAGWMFRTLTGAPVGGGEFWQALPIGVVAAVQLMWPLAVFVRERLEGRGSSALR